MYASYFLPSYQGGVSLTPPCSYGIICCGARERILRYSGGYTERQIIEKGGRQSGRPRTTNTRE